MSQWVYTVLRCRISFVVSPMLHGTSWSYTMRKDILDFTVSYLLHWTMIGYKDWNMNICCYIFFSWECLCYYITLLELVVLWIINDFSIMSSHLVGLMDSAGGSTEGGIMWKRCSFQGVCWNAELASLHWRSHRTSRGLAYIQNASVFCWFFRGFYYLSNEIIPVNRHCL